MRSVSLFVCSHGSAQSRCRCMLFERTGIATHAVVYGVGTVNEKGMQTIGHAEHAEVCAAGGR
eukprot:3392532-Alexandrium_andersonii.AAC.1